MADDPAQERELRESGELLAARGFQLEWREAAEVRRASGSDHLGGALFLPRDGGLDPARLCRGIARLVAGAEGKFEPACGFAGWSPKEGASASSPMAGISSPGGWSWRSTPMRRRCCRTSPARSGPSAARSSLPRRERAT